jgi:hypothetical protein
MVKAYECLQAGEFKYSCNGCFRMGFVNGSFVVSRSTTPDVPLYSIYSGSAVNVCSESNRIVFNTNSGAVDTILFGPVQYYGLYFFIADNSMIIFRNLYGNGYEGDYDRFTRYFDGESDLTCNP